MRETALEDRVKDLIAGKLELKIEAITGDSAVEQLAVEQLIDCIEKLIETSDVLNQSHRRGEPSPSRARPRH